MAIIHYSTGSNHFSTIDHGLSILWRSCSECIRKKWRYIMTWSFLSFWPLRCAKGISELGRVMKCRKYHPIWIGDDYHHTCINASSTLVPKVASTSKVVCMIRSSLYDEHQLRNTPHESTCDSSNQPDWNTCHILFGFWMIDDPKMPGRSSHANLTTTHPLSITQTLGGVPQFGLRWSLWKKSLMLVSWHDGFRCFSR